MSAPWTTAALLLSAACGPTVDLRIEVVDTNGDCTRKNVFSMIGSLSVEAIANDGTCRLRGACPSYSAREDSTLEDVVAALRDYDNVLIEVDPGDAQLLVLNGRPSESCLPLMFGDNNPLMCAYVSFDQVEDGNRLVLDLEADVDGEDRCPELLPFCH